MMVVVRRRWLGATAWLGREALACRRAAGEARGQILCSWTRMFAGPRRHRRIGRHDGDGRPPLSVHMELGSSTASGRGHHTVVGWLIRGAVDLDHVNDPPPVARERQLIAAGTKRDDALDGHGSVRSEVLEDVRLAEQFKCRGHRVGMRVAPWAFHVRLYEGLGEIVRGYTKNLYEGMGRRPSLALGAILFIFVGALLPWLLLVLGLIARLLLGWGVPQAPWLLWCGLVCVLQVIFGDVAFRTGVGMGRLRPSAREHHAFRDSLRSMFAMRRPGRDESSSTGRRKIHRKRRPVRPASRWSGRRDSNPRHPAWQADAFHHSRSGRCFNKRPEGVKHIHSRNRFSLWRWSARGHAGARHGHGVEQEDHSRVLVTVPRGASGSISGCPFCWSEGFPRPAGRSPPAAPDSRPDV